MKIVLTNVSPEQSASIARTVVEEKLAACVNAFPVNSYYQWEGKLEVDEEVTLLMKVPAAKVETLKERIRQLHSYDLPEILALPIDTEGSLRQYVDWVRAECGGG